ncbi:hypothetical protein ACLKA7_006717 [Drosophila subpalustris]
MWQGVGVGVRAKAMQSDNEAKQKELRLANRILKIYATSSGNNSGKWQLCSGYLQRVDKFNSQLARPIEVAMKYEYITANEMKVFVAASVFSVFKGAF